MPEEINRVVADHLATWCLAPTPAGAANLAAEGIIEGVLETGDLMQDLAARVAAELRGFDALLQAGIALAAAGGPDLAARLRPGGFVFVTIHRAEVREPPALAAWSAILGDAARSGRLVILALHPGTRVTLEGARVVLPAGVRVVEPLGYRTSLTLQLHAAAVLTDSGGIQREAAWLGTPCLGRARPAQSGSRRPVRRPRGYAPAAAPSPRLSRLIARPVHAFSRASHALSEAAYTAAARIEGAAR